MAPPQVKKSRSKDSQPRPIFHSLHKEVCHIVALPFTLKSILRQKKGIMEIQIFHHAKTLSSKKSSKRNQNLSRYHNSIINLKFQHKPKYHLSKLLL
jgi:hypothetical protein